MYTGVYTTTLRPSAPKQCNIALQGRPHWRSLIYSNFGVCTFSSGHKSVRVGIPRHGQESHQSRNVTCLLLLGARVSELADFLGQKCPLLSSDPSTLSCTGDFETRMNRVAPRGNLSRTMKGIVNGSRSTVGSCKERFEDRCRRCHLATVLLLRDPFSLCFLREAYSAVCVDSSSHRHSIDSRVRCAS